jgi:enoyl-CoA hydratase/carnithine racemase
MTTPLVNSSKHEGMIVLELSNPPANTSSYEMMRQLDAHVLDARFDESVHVLLITGAGEKFFCAGADINMLEGANPYFKNGGAL